MPSSALYAVSIDLNFNIATTAADGMLTAADDLILPDLLYAHFYSCCLDSSPVVR